MEAGSDLLERFPRRGLDLLLVVLPPIAIAVAALRSDLPVHLGVGEWILTHGRLPAADPFSFTASAPPWVPHEWLAGLLVALVERVGGATGLIALAGLSAGLLALAHRVVTALLGVSITSHLLWSVPLWLMAGQRMTLRPHLFALGLFFVAWGLLLAGRRRPALLWLLPPVMAVWVNVHGSFSLGFAIIGLDLVLCGHGHPLPWRRRFAVAALSGAALLMQLHTYVQADPLAALLHPFSLVSDPLYMRKIGEWRSPLGYRPFRDTFAFLISVPWIALCAWGFVRAGQRVPLSYRLFALIALVLYLRHLRFLALFALVSLPLLPAVSLPARSRWLVPARVAPLLAALFFLVQGFPMGARIPLRAPVFGWSPEIPLDAVDELVRRGYRGGVLCEYHYGALIFWRGRGALQPTMDSRNSVYDGALFYAHQRALAQPTAMRDELLDRVGAALIQRPLASARQRTSLVEQLERDERWQRIHVGSASVLYLKSTARAGGAVR